MKPKIVDWQFTSYGCGILDVAYYMVGNMQVKLRKENELKRKKQEEDLEEQRVKKEREELEAKYKQEETARNQKRDQLLQENTKLAEEQKR